MRRTTPLTAARVDDVPTIVAGRHVHRGSPADTVATGPGEEPWIDSEADSETDTVDTGAGGDEVTTGSTGGPNHDRVDTGPGTDYIDLATPALAPDGRITGGPDQDVLTVSPVPGDVAVDMSAGTLVTTAGNAAFSSLEDVTLTVGSGRVAFRGTVGDDSLTLLPASGAPTLDVETLAGDDHIVINPASVAVGSRISAGPGKDHLITAM